MHRFLWYFILQQGSIIPDTNNHNTNKCLKRSMAGSSNGSAGA